MQNQKHKGNQNLAYDSVDNEMEKVPFINNSMSTAFVVLLTFQFILLVFRDIFDGFINKLGIMEQIVMGTWLLPAVQLAIVLIMKNRE